MNFFCKIIMRIMIIYTQNHRNFEKKLFDKPIMLRIVIIAKPDPIGIVSTLYLSSVLYGFCTMPPLEIH